MRYTTKIYPIFCREDYKNSLKFELKHNLFPQLLVELMNKSEVKECGFRLVEDGKKDLFYFRQDYDETPCFGYYIYKVEMITNKYVDGIDEYVKTKLNEKFNDFDLNKINALEKIYNK